ncbi:MAG: cobyrinate a,c-diamide synthase [Thermoproteota archaeon]|jgi:cobyrinic acid a,c-diamide synthase|nr:cobyrinate a,c-diamide synthase [Thermoproteota archaeon]
MHVSRIIIAGVTSGVGKTTVAVGVMHGLRKRGLRVQPFKVGPDFIDPSYHALVTNRNSRNLDVWMMGRQGVLDCFASACKDADIAVVEGVMGLFDGMSGKSDFASTAHVAKILDAPVVLVVDASKGARSIAAIILGFLHFDRKLRIAAVILNNVAGERHANYITEALMGIVKIPVVGILARNSKIKMEERHLGLVPALELKENNSRVITRTAKYVAECIDLDKVLSLCSVTSLPGARDHLKQPSRASIAVALDESFNFYYTDNFIALKTAGARLIFFSPIKDQKLPEGVHGLMLGGGFPEVLADRLENNTLMVRSIRKAVDEGMPIYAECGGLMYLTRSISGYKGENKRRKMAGIIEADTLMTGRLTLNYTEAECNGSIFGKTHLRGHEFHYSSIENIAGDSRFAYSMKKGRGVTGNQDGFIINDNSLAAYMHLHFANRKLPERMVISCVRFSRR